MTTVYRYLGYGTTDSNGVAKLDHDANGDAISHSYTGTGAGEVDVVGSTDAPADISDSSFQSETYEVLDCMWYDDCTVSTHNTNWFNRYNLSTDYTGDVLKLTAGTNSGNYMPNKDGTATSISDVTEWIPSFALELDIINFDDGTGSNIGISTVGRSLTQLGITGETHLKVVYDGSTVKYYKDNSTTAIYTANLTTSPVYISIGVGSGHYITIKDVKIYPI